MLPRAKTQTVRKQARDWITLPAFIYYKLLFPFLFCQYLLFPAESYSKIRSKRSEISSKSLLFSIFNYFINFAIRLRRVPADITSGRSPQGAGLDNRGSYSPNIKIPFLNLSILYLSLIKLFQKTEESFSTRSAIKKSRSLSSSQYNPM